MINWIRNYSTDRISWKKVYLVNTIYRAKAYFNFKKVFFVGAGPLEIKIIM